MNEGREEEENQGNVGASADANASISGRPRTAASETNVEVFAREHIEGDIRRHQEAIVARTLSQRQQPNDNVTLNSIRSLYEPPDIAYQFIHGRRYCKDYFMPNDEEEQSRLQLIHEVYYFVLGNRHTTVPLVNPKKILDIGTGTGDWALAIGDEWPDAEIIGTDIAKIQPSAVPLNVFFEIDDAEEAGGWAWPDNEFDLIHFRYMTGAFLDWRHIYREAYKHLKPGGYIEVVDWDDHKTFASYFDIDADLPFLLREVMAAANRSGRSREGIHLDPSILTELGFVDVACKELQIPMGPWPENLEAQRTGKHFLMSILTGMEALTLRLLVEQAGWSYEAVQELCEDTKELIWKVALDPMAGKGLGFNVRVLTGRKPVVGEGRDGSI